MLICSQSLHAEIWLHYSAPLVDQVKAQFLQSSSQLSFKKSQCFNVKRTISGQHFFLSFSEVCERGSLGKFKKQSKQRCVVNFTESKQLFSYFWFSRCPITASSSVSQCFLQVAFIHSYTPAANFQQRDCTLAPEILRKKIAAYEIAATLARQQTSIFCPCYTLYSLFWKNSHCLPRLLCWPLFHELFTIHCILCCKE